MPFTALITFFSEETNSEYVEGLNYTARSQRLVDLVENWISEGKVKWSTIEAEIRGEG